LDHGHRCDTLYLLALVAGVHLLELKTKAGFVTHRLSRSNWLKVFTVLLMTGLFTEGAPAEDWPQWLGPNREPVWREDGIVESFPEGGPPLRWKAPIGGGYSGPAVADGLVFVMDRVPEVADIRAGKVIPDRNPLNNDNFVRRLLPGAERVVCLKESDGSIVWVHEYDCPYTTVATYAIGPRCTPTVDGDRVYTLGSEGHLKCLSVSDGTVVWSKNFREDYGLKVPHWGVAGHPLVDGDRLICVVGGPDAVCVAFDKRSGKEIWRALSASEPGYCPAVIQKIGSEHHLVVWHSDAVCGMNPESGDVYWTVPFKSTFAMAVGAPQFSGRSMFLMSFNRKSGMVRIADDNRSARIVWTGNARRGIGGVLNTAIINDGYIYACGNGGRYICASLETGERLWSTFEMTVGKRPASWGNVFSIQHKHRYFHANDVGELIIARMSPTGYDEVSRAQLIEPTHDVGGRKLVWSHPAFANRSIYLRNDKEIRCYSLAIEP